MGSPVEVKAALHDLFRQREVEYIFGNPGSTELPFLAGLPSSIQYVMALQEVSVTAMAAGYALRSGRTPVISLHSAPGLGNAMGALHNMSTAHLPAVVIVGQQDSRHLHSDPVLSADLVALGAPVAKWSHQPISERDVPRAVERAFRIAETGTPGPVVISLPMNFFEGDAAPAVARTVRSSPGTQSPEVKELASWLDSGTNVALVAGDRVPSSGAWNEAVELAERLHADVYGAAMESLAGFPSDHQLYRHQLPVTEQAVARVLAPYDRVLVLGADSFGYYPYSAESSLRSDAQIAVISDVQSHLEGVELAGPLLLFGNMPSSIRAVSDALTALPGRGELGAPNEESLQGVVRSSEAEFRNQSPIPVKSAIRALCMLQEQGIVLVDEALSSTAVLLRYWRQSEARDYLHSSDGGIGFGIPAAVGAALSRDTAGSVCVVGDGSFYYSPQAIWTAAQLELNVKIVVLNNGGYKILKDYHESVSAHLGKMPSLRISGTDICQVAGGFGAETRRVDSLDQLPGAIDWLKSVHGTALLEMAIEWSDRSMFS
jgi:benzoylformate decarboxylase